MNRPRFAGTNYAAACISILLVLLGCEESARITPCCLDPDDSEFSLSVARYPDNKKAALSITFDDGCSSVFDKIVPMLDSYHFKGTFYIIAGHVELRNEWAKWKSVLDGGHDIGNHSLTHEYYLGSIKDKKILRAEIDSSFRLIRDRLGKRPFSFGHPFHNASPMADKIVFENHFTSKVSPPGFSKLLSLYDLSICRAEIQAALKTGDWLVTTAHGVDDEFCYNTLTSDFFVNFLDYVKAHSDSIHVDTFENLSKYKIEFTNTRLQVERTSGGYLVKLKNELPGDIFNHPLTVAIRGLKNANERIKRNDAPLEVAISGDNVNVKILPNGSFIILDE